MEDWHNVSIGNRNLASLYTYLGDLDRADKFARVALRMTKRRQINVIHSLG